VRAVFAASSSIGSPAGLKQTATGGIISGKRTIGGTGYLQTDTPINPGSSGGPLIDQRGHVVGVNTLILGGMEGIGFALPVRAARDAFPGILESRR